MSDIKKYTGVAYENKLLLYEKILIEKTLKKVRGRIKDAHEILCPNDFYTYSAFLKVVRKHNIKASDYKPKPKPFNWYEKIH